LGGEIAACGGIVVSGMAAGIDAQAIEGALQAGRPAVGVLGCGVDRIYPAENRKLFQAVEQHGCLISEFPPGTLPQKWTFPKRNRLISGLSCGVVVVEAPERSGALITANRALEQDRDVFVVPGHLDEPNCAGSNALMRQGAIVVTCGWDVVSEYEHLFPNVIEKRAFVPEKLPEPELPAAASKPVKNAEPAAVAVPAVDIEKLASTLSADQRKLLELLQDGEKLVDDLILQSGLGSGAVLGAITMMEIRGIVKTLPGDRVAIQS
jgi:DNA processing protein